MSDFLMNLLGMAMLILLLVMSVFLILICREYCWNFGMGGI